jgi:hypothetical protein
MGETTNTKNNASQTHHPEVIMRGVGATYWPVNPA